MQRSLKVLIVSANESTTQQFNALKHFYKNPQVSLNFTDNEKFMSGSLVSRFDIALLANFDTDMTTDDFEMQADFFDHYMNAPISAFVSTVQGRCDAVIPDGLKEKCAKVYEANFPPENATEAVPWLGTAVEELAGQYKEEFESKVTPAFQKFDKDGSGAIDLQEFKAMTAELGQALSDDQVETAVADLDINGDGLIDLEEFAQWYFSGMKDYSRTRRTFLKFKKGLASFAGTTLSQGGLADVFKQDPRTISHNSRVSFNKPAAPQCVAKAKFTIVGPRHNELLAEAKAFQAELGLAQDGSICFYIKVVLLSSDEAWAAAEPIYKYMRQDENEEWEQQIKERSGHLDVKYADSKITVRYMEYFAADSGDFRDIYMPQEIVDALKTVDTSVSARVELATSPEEILKSETAMAECALKGFDVEVNATYMRKFAKVLKDFPPLAEPMTMGGFALGVSTDVALDLDYTDIEELKEHPMAGQFINLAFNDVFGMVGMQREMLEGFELKFTEKHHAIAANPEHPSYHRLMPVKTADCLIKVIESLDSGASAVQAHCVHENLFTGSVDVKAPGAGHLGSMAIKWIAMKEGIADALQMIDE